MQGFPELVATYPVNGSTDVQYNVGSGTDITLDWSTDLDSEQLQDTDYFNTKFFLVAENTNTPVTVSYKSYTPRQRRLVISATLTPLYSYRLIIRKGLVDSSGRKSVMDYTVYFKTASAAFPATVSLYPPDSVLLDTEPYQFSWTTSAASGVSVSYLLKFYEGVSQVASFATTSASLTLTNTSFEGVWGSVYGKRLSWDVVSRASTASGYIYNPPSERRTLTFGPLEDDTDPTSARTYRYRQTVVPAEFLVESYTPENLLTNLGVYPDITLTFTEKIATGSMLNYIKVTRKAQIPRNDDPTTYREYSVAGSWANGGTDLTWTFTPTEDIAFNTRYELKVLPGLLSETGRKLTTGMKTQFSSWYNPYYTDIRAIKARLRSEASSMPDDMINYYIHMVSLEAKAKYAVWLHGVPAAGYMGDSLNEIWVRDSTNLKSFGVGKWVEAATCYEIYRSILVDDIREVGRRRKLADYEDSLDGAFVKALEVAKNECKEDMTYWEGFIVTDNTPLTSSRGNRYDYPWPIDDWNLSNDIRFRVREIQ